MSNRDKAARIVGKTLSRWDMDGRPDIPGGIDAHITEALADAGLLMPESPEMKECYGTVQNNWVSVNDDGALWIHYRVDDSPLAPTEARHLAYALLAAADHAEEEA